MEAILFDLDGTLIDSFEGVAKSSQYALHKMGIEEEDIEKFRPFIGPPLMDSFQKWYGLSKEQALDAIEIYRERYQSVGLFECRLYPGVRECVIALKNQGYRIGIASSKPEEYCKKILEHFELLDLFDDVVGATFDHRIDTKEEVLQEAMRRYCDIPKEKICLVGDTMFDLEGAKSIGIDCIAVRYGFGDADEMLREGAVAAAASMDELPDVIAAMSKN